MKRLAVALFVISWFATAVVDARQAPPPIPAKPGIAAGTVKVGNITVTLTHAYVGLLADGNYQVVLTDAPIPAEAVAAEVRFGGGQRTLRSGKASGVSMLVTDKGFLLNIIPFIGADLRGGISMGSAGTLAVFKGSTTSVTGQGSMKPEDTGDKKWSYSASWNAVPVIVK